MFGDVAFAQAPFAASIGSILDVAVSAQAQALAAFDGSTIKGGNQDEDVTASDARSVIGTMTGSVAETSTGSDLLSVIATMVATAAEAASATMAATNTANMLATQSETATATATQAAIGTFLASLAEQADATGVFNGGRVFSVSVDETSTGDDAVANTLSATATIYEVVTGAPLVSVLRQANVYPTGVQLLVRIGDSLVWVQVNDGQTPNWTEIPS